MNRQGRQGRQERQEGNGNICYSFVPFANLRALCVNAFDF
jgi:hypothetical protein